MAAPPTLPRAPIGSRLLRTTLPSAKNCRLAQWATAIRQARAPEAFVALPIISHDPESGQEPLTPRAGSDHQTRYRFPIAVIEKQIISNLHFEMRQVSTTQLPAVDARNINPIDRGFSTGSRIIRPSRVPLCCPELAPARKLLRGNRKLKHTLHRPNLSRHSSACR